MGYTFTGWSSDEVSVPNPNSAETSFSMPAKNVTVTANWEEDNHEPGEYTVTIAGGGTGSSGAGSHTAGQTVYIDAGEREGYTFSGWTGPDGVSFANASSPSTNFIMPAKNVTVTAGWTQNSSTDPAGTFTVTVNGSEAAISGAGYYPSGATVTIDAGTRSGYTFTGWSSADGVSFGDASSAQTTFIMPAHAVTVTAGWTPNTSPEPALYSVTVNGSYADRSGAGNYPEGADVVIDAGTRSGYSFHGWAGPVGFLDAGNFRTSFTMPAENITVTANWRQDSSGGNSSGSSGENSSSGSNSGGSGNSGGSSSGSSGNSGNSGGSGSKKEKDEQPTPAKNLPQSTSNYIPAAAQGQQRTAFSDVDAGAWYSAAVAYASQKGFMSGTGNGRFSPDAVITRGQLVSILYRLEGSPAASGAIPFPDVSDSAYYADAVRWTTQHQIAGGYTNGRFGAADPVTTEQLCAFLSRYAQCKGLSTAAQANQLDRFSDRWQVSSYAAGPLAWAVSQGIVSGNTRGELMPQKQATRAQAAMIFMLFCENVL